jgi:release factor glutamine methyltransferase
MDASEEALALAGENAARLGIEVELVHGDVRDGLPPGPFDLVVANPPYVAPDEWTTLEPEVREWEPREALVDEGQTELVVRHALGVLRSGGALVLEVHEERSHPVAAALREAGYRDVLVTRDLAGRDRVVEGRR